jgi:hypothetical protein
MMFFIHLVYFFDNVVYKKWCAKQHAPKGSCAPPFQTPGLQIVGFWFDRYGGGEKQEKIKL